MKACPLITALGTTRISVLYSSGLRGVWSKKITPLPRAPFIGHISHYCHPSEKWSSNLCAFLLCGEACAVSQRCSCVQLVGEMFLWISVLPNRLGQERGSEESQTGSSFFLPFNTMPSDRFVLPSTRFSGIHKMHAVAFNEMPQLHITVKVCIYRNFTALTLNQIQSYSQSDLLQHRFAMMHV